MSEWIDIKEFRESGYLEEVNRRFFHPIGLAMAVHVDDEGVETIAGIYDDREDPEGWIMGYSSWPDPDVQRARARERAMFIDAERNKRAMARFTKFGWITQPPGVDAPA